MTNPTPPLQWHFKLYLAGNTPRSAMALGNLTRLLGNLTRLCDVHLAGRHTIEVVDLLKSPALAARDQIFAVPTHVRLSPEPIKKIVGDLSNEKRVLSVFGLSSS